MGSFGDKLKRERELRGVTLEEISKATKIGLRALQALEEEHFEQLPGGIFNKGFVRSYAKFLGLDEEQMVSDFMVAQGDKDAQKPDLMASLAVKAEAQRRSEIAASGGEKGRSTSTWVTLALLVLVTAGAAAGVRYYKMKKEAAAQPKKVRVESQAPQQVAAATPIETSLSPAPVNSALAGPDGAQVATSPAGPVPRNAAAKGSLELQIHVSKATWVSVQADEKPEVAETLRDSATKTVNAQNKVVITTGNSVDVTCNGKPLGILGTDNQRSEMKISADCKVN